MPPTEPITVECPRCGVPNPWDDRAEPKYQCLGCGMASGERCDQCLDPIDPQDRQKTWGTCDSCYEAPNDIRP